MHIELITLSDHRFSSGLARLLPACGLVVCESPTNYKVDARLVICEKPNTAVAGICREATRGKPPVFVFARYSSGLDQVNCLRLGAYKVYGGHFAVPQLIGDLSALPAQGNEIVKGELVIQSAGATWKNTPLSLSRKQLSALRALASHTVVSRDQLSIALGGSSLVAPAALDAVIRRLREKLPRELSQHIKSVYGLGYSLRL